MKPAPEPEPSRPEPRASLKKPHESCPFVAPCWPSSEENKPWSEISVSLTNAPVRTLYFDLATWVHPSRPASPRPSSVPGANLKLIHRLLSSFPLSAEVRQFGVMTVGTKGLACGFNWQCTPNDLGYYAVSWSQHAWTPYRLLTFTVWVHPGREAVRAGHTTYNKQ